MAALFSRIKVNALCARASTLRNGISCTIPALTYDHENRFTVWGGMNYHIPINFSDGVTWLCRIRRRNVTSPPLALQNRLILSEAATYRILATTAVPVPDVYDVAINSPSNPVVVGYILMEKLKGTPLTNCTIDSDATKVHVLEQLADIFIALARHPLPAIGCLLGPDNLTICPILEESAVDSRDDGDICLLGPFKSVLEYRNALVNHQIDCILRGECYPDNAIDAYLVHQYVLDALPSIVRREQDDHSFFIKHMDDKGDHILVDDSFNIVGLIDWEWAQTTTKSEAFAAPSYLLDVRQYFEGSNKLSPDEVLLASILEAKGHDDLASCVRDGRVTHRFAHCVGGDIGDPDSLPNHFLGLRAALRRTGLGETWAQWRETALQRNVNVNDAGLRSLMLRER
jgi:hypothetical protein